MNINDYSLPDVAHEALSRRNLTDVSLGAGINRLVEHDMRGLPYRFEIHTQYNKLKSQTAKYEVYDEIEIIRWFRDRFDQPVEIVRLLPEALLDLNDPDEPRGAYAESYRRFKEGRLAPGTPLSKWGVLSDGQVATLAHRNIFSVEQLASTPKNKIQSVLPAEFLEAWERAHQFVASKENRFQADKQADEIAKLSANNEALQRQLETMQAQMQQLLQAKQQEGFINPVTANVDLEAAIEGLSDLDSSTVIKRGRGRPPKSNI